MHKIHAKEFTLEDFSCEHLFDCWSFDYKHALMLTIEGLNQARRSFLAAEDSDTAKRYWWQMIQLLPSSYNQKRTVMLNYEVLANIYKWRKDHKLDEWRSFCTYIENCLPYSELITGTTHES